MIYEFCNFLLIFVFMNFPDFEKLLQTYPTSRIEEYQRAYSLKASLLGKVASQRVVEQEKINKKLSEELKKLNRDFNLSRAANVDLEKKVVELAEALKRCQDEKKVVEESFANSRKDLEKLQKTHDDDLKLIDNLHKDCDKSSKTAEDLRVNNTDLANTLSSKEQKIQDLEKPLADRKESSEKGISDVRNKLGLLFKEYEKDLIEFSVRPAPVPVDMGMSDIMEWIDMEFRALPEVISGANDFTAAFSAESILQLLHDFDCVDLAKFREKLPQFPDASSTSRIRSNADVFAIKAKFAREFWFSSAKEVVKNIACAKLEKFFFSRTLLLFANSQTFVFWFSLIPYFALFS
jgi:predicted  nucleic acid-binding Zn-ribbon protein